MAAKTDGKEATEAPAAQAAPAEAAAKSGGIGSWIPAIVALVLSPAATWAVANFVLIPKLEAKLGGEAPAHAAEASHAEKESAPKHGSEGGHGEGGEGGDTFKFENVVVNLAGTMGTRYLKASFVVTGAEPGIKESFEGKKAQLTDITLNVLSSLTLADLEQPGAKNVLRERLVTSYNQAFGHKVAEQVYFSDFVIQ